MDCLSSLVKQTVVFQEVEAKASSMDQAIIALREFVRNITNGTQGAEDMLKQSEDHAKNLKDQADFLEK